jgi:ribonuclease P protein component
MPVAPKVVPVSRSDKNTDQGIDQNAGQYSGLAVPAASGQASLALSMRDARLVKPGEFEKVFKDNERARTDSLLVMARPNNLGHARLGMVIAKRLLPRAVDRNRIKRCVRETFRLQRQDLPACDFVVRLIAKPIAGDETRDLARILKRAGQRAISKLPALPITD